MKAKHTSVGGHHTDEINSLSETQDQLFSAMLAEMDSRIDEITARTDRLLAQHA